ncbi:MAG: endonuclease/exonuclease/phosphatase family protein [Acidimicrobiia bacterium]
MRIASFNIRGARLTPRAGLPPLVDACVALDADILGLEEVHRHKRRSGFADQAAFVARGLGCDHIFGPTRRRVIRGQYGNALITRGLIKESEVRLLPGTGTQQPRAAILAVVEVQGTAVSVGVTHLQHHPKRLRHLPNEAPDQLRAVLAWLKELPTPRVLIGDLNLQPKRAVPMITDAGFEVAITGPAYPAEQPTVQLDYIAVDGFVIESASVLPMADVSDHRPIVADVRLPKKRSSASPRIR